MKVSDLVDFDVAQDYWDYVNLERNDFLVRHGGRI